jgi:hypothetical protein
LKVEDKGEDKPKGEFNLKVEDKGEDKPKGEFNLRLEETIFFFFSKPQNPDIASLHLNSA